MQLSLVSQVEVTGSTNLSSSIRSVLTLPTSISYSLNHNVYHRKFPLFSMTVLVNCSGTVSIFIGELNLWTCFSIPEGKFVSLTPPDYFFCLFVFQFSLLHQHGQCTRFSILFQRFNLSFLIGRHWWEDSIIFQKLYFYYRYRLVVISQKRLQEGSCNFSQRLLNFQPPKDCRHQDTAIDRLLAERYI